MDLEVSCKSKYSDISIKSNKTHRLLTDSTHLPFHEHIFESILEGEIQRLRGEISDHVCQVSSP